MAQDKRLFLNDLECDLGDSPIGLTFQINNLSDVKSQQGNTSNQFSLPMTQRNRIACGFPDDVPTTTNLPYTKFRARYIQNDIEMPFVVAIINGCDDKSIQITLISGNIDFFDLIGGQLADMGDSTSQWSEYGANLPWKTYDHIWNLDNVSGSQNKTTGWLYPVIDYGLMTDDFTLPLDVRYMRPGFFIKTAIDLLLAYTGYRGKGSLLSNPLYPLLIAQFSNSSWDHGLDYQNQLDGRGMNAGTLQDLNVTENYSPGANKGIISFPNVIYDPASQFSGGTTFTAGQIENVNILLTIPRFRFQGHASGNHPSSVIIMIFLVDGSTELALTSMTFDFYGGFHRISGSGGSITGYMEWVNQKISFDTELAPGQKISIRYEFFGDQPNYFTMYSGASLLIRSNNQKVLFGQSVQCERIFPDMSQKDLIKDTLQRFGIICQTDIYAKTVTFASLKDIVDNIPVAKDWSRKVLNQGKQVSYQLGGGYSQVNYLEYQQDPNSGQTIIPLKYGWSKILIKDEVLSPYATDLVQSKFSPSLNMPFLGGSTAKIQMIDPTSGSNELSLSVAPRILISNKVNLLALNKSVTFTDGVSNVVVNDTIDCPYFYKPGGKYSLMWEDLRLLYYPELERILKQCKKVVRYFMLTPRDIYELDLLIPIYIEQDGCYYYINKIDSWVNKTPCKVELVKLG